MNEIQLTKEHLKMFRTSRNGLTGLTMEILTGTRKPIKGWFRRSKGKVISIEDFHRILQDVERLERSR